MGEQSGRERKQFWLSDPLWRPERTAEKRERERERERQREFGTMVIVEFLRFLWFT